MDTKYLKKYFYSHGVVTFGVVDSVVGLVVFTFTVVLIVVCTDVTFLVAVMFVVLGLEVKAMKGENKCYQETLSIKISLKKIIENLILCSTQKELVITYLGWESMLI